MHILLLDPHYWFDFEALGHTVTAVPLTEYETPLGQLLEKLPLPPDCIIQQEILGTRHFLTGLDEAPCPTLYLAFDAHLNLYWQRYYARLFDAALTPHLSLFEVLPPEDRPPRTFRQLPPGTDLAWKSHTERQYPLGFCGRITPTRPLRARMASLLQTRFGLELRQDIPPEAMFRFYRETRVVPNEAICFEVNCRLFESASAGSAILTPDCGPDQTAAFTDGEEMLVYHDGLDLLEKTAWLLANPAEAETMGRKARERVKREHLPRHRAAALLAILPSLARHRATGQEAAALTWLTRLERAKSGDQQHPASRLLAQYETLPERPDVLAGILHLLGTPGRKGPALDFCRMLLAAPVAPSLPPASFAPCNAAASACALAHGDTDLARLFYARQFPAAPIPASPSGLCRAWAEEERQAGRTVRPGFSFHPEAGHLPACALEFLVFAGHLQPSEKPALAKEQAALVAPFPAYADYRLALLETPPPASPRELEELGKLLLFCCRVDEGLSVLENLTRHRQKPST